MPTPHRASQVVMRRAGEAAHDHACRPCAAEEVESEVKGHNTNACAAHTQKKKKRVVVGRSKKHRSHFFPSRAQHCLTEAAFFSALELFFWNFVPFTIQQGGLEVGQVAKCGRGSTARRNRDASRWLASPKKSSAFFETPPRRRGKVPTTQPRCAPTNQKSAKAPCI